MYNIFFVESILLQLVTILANDKMETKLFMMLLRKTSDNYDLIILIDLLNSSDSICKSFILQLDKHRLKHVLRLIISVFLQLIFRLKKVTRFYCWLYRVWRLGWLSFQRFKISQVFKYFLNENYLCLRYIWTYHQNIQRDWMRHIHIHEFKLILRVSGYSLRMEKSNLR